MDLPPTALYLSRPHLARLAVRVNVPILLMGGVAMALLSRLSPEQRASAPPPLSWLFGHSAWAFAALLLGGAVLSGVAIVAPAMRRGKPALTLTRDGLELREGYFVPWQHVTAIRRWSHLGMERLSVELVSDHWALRAQAQGLSGWAAWQAKFLSPVMTVGPARVPTVTVLPSQLGATAGELIAAMERYRAARERQVGGSSGGPGYVAQSGSVVV